MSTGDFAVGHDCKLYRNTGTYAVPVWVEVDEVGDVSIADFERAVAELRRRASDFVKGIPTIIELIAIEGTFLHKPSDASFTAMRTNFLAGTSEEFAVMNGGIGTTGNQGLRVPLIITQFPWNQPLTEVSGHEIRLVTAYHEDSGTEIDPAWYTVPAVT